jgi:ribosomal protein S18 acetylase RimI-like enzyme
MPTLSRLTEADDGRLDEVLHIYREAIPERERKPDEEIAAMLGSPRHVLTVAEEDRRVVAFSMLYAGEQLAVLEYLASDERLRGQGIGAALYRNARGDVGARPLIVEVESDRTGGRDQTIRARRIGFYRRFGCRRVADFNFVLPLAGTADPPRLDLLVDGWEKPTVARSDFARWLTEMYVGVYACRPDDPRLVGMIAGLPAELTLE